jgi:hypothetical protein
MIDPTISGRFGKMAMRITYTTFNGKIFSETRNGVQSDYLTDTSGNPIGFMNAAHEVWSGWQSWGCGNGAPSTEFENDTSQSTAERTDTKILNSIINHLEESR